MFYPCVEGCFTYVSAIVWAPFHNLIRSIFVRSRDLEKNRFVVLIVASLWNLTGTSTAVLPRCMSNFRAIGQFQIQISQLRNFPRSYIETSYRLLKQSPDCLCASDVMMTSSNGSIFRVTVPLCGEFSGEFSAQRPVTRSFDVFHDLNGWDAITHIVTSEQCNREGCG